MVLYMLEKELNASRQAGGKTIHGLIQYVVGLHGQGKQSRKRRIALTGFGSPRCALLHPCLFIRSLYLLTPALETLVCRSYVWACVAAPVVRLAFLTAPLTPAPASL